MTANRKLRFALAGALCVFAPIAADAEPTGKGQYEEHYETLPADVDPAGAATDPMEAPASPSQRSSRDDAAPRSAREPDAAPPNRRDERAVPERAANDSRLAPRPRAVDDADPTDDVADIAFFFDTLDEGGEWLDHPRYGDVWRPKVADDWRPYTLGRWAYSEDFGWTWISDEPFGWAVYHYGRWTYDTAEGWLWVPGTQWGPAWVAWRQGEEAIGWAPLPPDARFERGRLAFDQTVLESERYERMWVFVRPRYFARAEMRRYLRPASWNAELRYRTAPRLGYERFEDKRKRRYFANRGLTPDDVERFANRPLPRIKIEAIDEPALRKRPKGEESRSMDGREVRIYRPDRSRTEAVKKRPRPAAVRARDDSTTAQSEKITKDKGALPPPPPGAGHQLDASERPRVPAAPKSIGGSAEIGASNAGPQDKSASDKKPSDKTAPDKSGDQASKPSTPSTSESMPRAGSGATTGSTTRTAVSPGAGGAPPDDKPAAAAKPGKKRWDGSGPSGAPSTSADAPNPDQP